MPAMTKSEIKEKLVTSFENQLRFEVELAEYTSFKIGGKADIFFTPSNIEYLRTYANFVRKKSRAGSTIQRIFDCFAVNFLIE